MNLITIVLRTLTETPITMGPITYPPNVDVTLFDLADKATYGVALYTLSTFDGNLREYCLSGQMLCTINGNPVTTLDEFNIICIQLAPMLFTHQAGFMLEQRFHFDMSSKTWCIIDPLTGDTYAVQMTKI